MNQLLSGKLEALQQPEVCAELAAAYPWYPISHWLQAARNAEDTALLQKAALYAPDVLRLHLFVHGVGEEEVEVEDKVEVKNEVEEEVKVQEEVKTEVEEKIEVETKAEEKIEAEEVVEPIAPAEQGFEESPAVQEAEVAAETSAEAQVPTDTPEAEEEPTAEDQSENDEALEDNEDRPAWAKNLAKQLEDKPGDMALPLLEPYHTVDYFASQGIRTDKLENPLMPPTKLDSQVKSFTEWLKTMKKLNHQPTTTYTDPAVDKKADQSILSETIVTEAMAEVWLKQGNKAQAIKIFGKLILAHPEKSSYFAARIKDLNEQK